MKYSQIYFDFDAEILESIAYILSLGVAGRLEIADTKVASITAHRATWNAKMILYKAAETHTAAVIDMKAIYAILHPEMENLKKQLKANTDIVLTGTDYTKIHIHEDADARVHVPKPTITPGNSTSNTSHCANKFFAFNPTEGEEAKKALPVDVKKIGRKVYYANHGDPLPALDKYTLLDAIGTSTFTIVCTAEQAHKQGYLITWYINNRGEAGPESDPFPFDTV